MRDVLEVSLERRQEAHVVLGLHEERAEVLTQVLERVVDAAVDVHEALDSRRLELLVQRAERSATFAPVVDLRQRTVALTPRDYDQRYDTIRDAILTCARKPT